MRIASRRHGVDAARGQRYSGALSPLTPPAIIRYWTARIAARAQHAGRFASTSYRWVACGVAASLMTLAPLAESRWLRRIRRTPAQHATRPGQASGGDLPAAASLGSQSQAPAARVTVTQAGVRIVDKRRVAVRPAAEDTGAAGEGPAQPRPADQARQHRRWRQASVKLSDAAWFPALGKIG